MHLFMATNEDWAHQAGFKERRFFTLRVSDAHLQDHAYFGQPADDEGPAHRFRGLSSVAQFAVGDAGRS
jgi:hypothetical protein